METKGAQIRTKTQIVTCGNRIQEIRKRTRTRTHLKEYVHTCVYLYVYLEGREDDDDDDDDDEVEEDTPEERGAVFAAFDFGSREFLRIIRENKINKEYICIYGEERVEVRA